MPLNISLGIDDFRKLREGELAYVDKSHLIRELLDAPGAEVVLLPRPRRFGKTLNLSMLRCFFEKRDEDLSHLFQDLSIWQAGEPYRAHFQRYPVISLSFKGTKAQTFDDCWVSLKEKISVLFMEHRYLLDGDSLNEWEQSNYRAILDGTAHRALYARSLLDLSRYLHAHQGEKVIVLLDEYDEPIHAGHACGYAPQILDFVRALFAEGLKSNPHLYRGVVTGILRVAKENLFSGANNFGVYTLLAKQYRTCCGFTEPEVSALLDRAGRADRMEVVRAWYNGYLFGDEVVYNPWSVLKFLQRDEDQPGLYWVSTSSNDLVRELLEENAFELEPTFEALLAGGSIERVLDENVPLGDLHTSEGALWSLLVFSGYLKAERRPGSPMELLAHRLSIPNLEVRQIYATTFRTWMEARMRGRGGNLDKLVRGLLAGDAEVFEEQLQAFVVNVLSYHDPGALDPERVYQGFVLGLLAVLEPAHEVRSNRELGEGRPDVVIRPREPGKPTVVLELKVAKKGKKTPEAAIREGVKQIRERGYLTETAGAVIAYAVAFDGKKVWVKAVAEPAKRPKKGRAKRARR